MPFFGRKIVALKKSQRVKSAVLKMFDLYWIHLTNVFNINVLFLYVKRQYVQQWETHSTGGKCGSFQMLLVDARHSRYWEHPCSFFNRAVVGIGEGFAGSLAVLFTSQNCLWAAFGHQHNVVINKSIFRHSVYMYLYIHTHISTCHNPYWWYKWEKSQHKQVWKLSPCNFYFSLEGVSVRKLCNTCHSDCRKKK